jgi:LysM repeat protein
MSRKYQVQPGDVLTKIAQRFYVCVNRYLEVAPAA